MERFKAWLIRILGLDKNSKYIREYQRDANVGSSLFMSSILIILEIYMIIRYIYRYFYLMPDKYDITVSSFFQYTGSYWIMLIAGLLMFIYGHMYLTGRITRFRSLSNLCISLFSGLCLVFGAFVSFGDYQRGKMIICFLTMTLYVASMLIWRPYVTAFILLGIGYGYYHILSEHAVDYYTGEPLEFNSGDAVNYMTFFITLAMLAVSVYHQRHREAIEAEKLYMASITDDLTGIPNMTRFERACKEYIKHEDTEANPLTYLFFDIENFKTYNDQLGYVQGNLFLKSIAQIIEATFSDEPYARQGDDHFVVLTRVDTAREKVRLVRDCVHEITDYEGYIALKIGVYTPKDYNLEPRLCVDRARYAVGYIKNRSDEHFRKYDEQMDSEFRQREYVLNNIDKAINNGYIHVYYQPVVDAKDGTVTSCEALVRWIDPKVGILNPGAFVPILEESRQIHKLDKCVYEIVCHDIKNRMDKGLPVVPVSLNFSRIDFELMDVVEGLDSLVTSLGIPRDYFHVELTESALTSDVEALKREMKRFSDLGYALWLDDFGSGYSSLNVLKDFNFDMLKIDMVFLRGLEENQNAKSILKYIIGLADEIGMETLTEGVETKEAADYLRMLGCSRLQGFYFGKPMPVEELTAKFESGEYKVVVKQQ